MGWLKAARAISSLSSRSFLIAGMVPLRSPCALVSPKHSGSNVSGSTCPRSGWSLDEMRQQQQQQQQHKHLWRSGAGGAWYPPEQPANKSPGLAPQQSSLGSLSHGEPNVP